MAIRSASLIMFLAVLAGTGACGGGTDRAGAHDPLRITRSARLPNWATEEELRLQEKAGPPDPSLDRAPPPQGYRVPAEYEPIQAVLMTWSDYQTMLRQIAQNAAAAGAEVWMVGGPASLTGVPASQYQALDFPFDSVWTRDYGPVGIHQATGTLGIVDPTYRHWASRPDDDAIPCRLAQEIGAGCYTTSLIMDGGNFMTDGRGNVFVTERVYEWNSSLSRAQVNQLLMDYFGAETLHVFAYAHDSQGRPADGTGHIDMFAKLLGDCKVLVAETSESPFAAPLQAAADYFSALECLPGRNFQVFRVSSWADRGTWYTYTNALIVNQTVIVPGYAEGDDQAARAVYQSALPGYTVVTVNADDSIWAGGAIHCVVEQIPAPQPAECNDPADCDLSHVDQHDCLAGLCFIASCDAGWADCDGERADGCETRLGTVADCASCGDACSFANAGASCQDGACQMGACSTGFGNCNGTASDGCETQLGTAANCSACDDTCSFANAGALCQGGTCRLGACNTDFGNCNGQEADGCETQLGTVTDCAGCGNACSFANAGALCQGGTCRLGACNTGFGNCNGQEADGCETPLDTATDCGGCGIACPAGQTCNLVAGGRACGRSCPDGDGDGHLSPACGGDDCDDADGSVFPGAAEACNDRDDDCDQQVDEDDACRTEGSGGGCGCGNAGKNVRTGWPAALLVLLGRRRRVDPSPRSSQTRPA